MAEPAVSPASSFIGNAQQTFNLRQSQRGPLAVPLNIDFSAVTVYQVDLSTIQQNDTIDFVQTLFIDNSGGSAPIVCYNGSSQQTVSCPPGSQGYFPFLCPQPVRFLVSSAGGFNKAQVTVLNFPVQPGVWGANDSPAPPFVFTPSGELAVSDTAMDALVNTRYAATPALDVNVIGGSPILSPARMADINTSGTTTLLAAVAGMTLEVFSIQVWMSPDATAAGGAYIDWLVRDDGATDFDLASGRIWVPAATVAPAGIVQGPTLADMTALNYRSSNAAGTSSLVFVSTAALATGKYKVRVLARMAA